ncbi:ADP-ribose glycohydrolase MACROD1 [Sarcoptes scabiei]|nr:ADP-ribose glycohydrolase MACROD1 [Sarcoptes scabiei]
MSLICSNKFLCLIQALSINQKICLRAMSFQMVKEKRKNYRCEKFVTLDQVPSWAESKSTSSIGSEYHSDPNLNSKISTFNGDITQLEIDAIVNAANERLAGGGGVDGFIHRAAGHDDLQAECRTLNGCQTGSCKITGGYRLPAKYIIHCVGPIGEKPELLASCYRQALDTLIKENLRTIAFPCISTGVFGYPNENAAKVALATTRDWLQRDSNHKKIERIIFCLFLEKDIKIYEDLLNRYFPH